MAPSFDCVSSLLCAEDNSIFDDNEYGGVMEQFEDTWNHIYHRFYNQNQYFDDPYRLPLQSDECLALMVEKEGQHLPGADYLNRLRNGDLDFGARKEAIDWIEKVGSILRVIFFCFLLVSSKFNLLVKHGYLCILLE
ncbi:hypothetical protein L6164_030650 [Bauhinia variegata]|uniref:Uncharacterized protein n=1 Tax=Bauhinia variegata TaxID=167791 RepID=A0ACB9LCG6_BAUVA|nr:hypothetical protein L6164_030650 [Bauhinia variegata]